MAPTPGQVGFPRPSVKQVGKGKDVRHPGHLPETLVQTGHGLVVDKHQIDRPVRSTEGLHQIGQRSGWKPDHGPVIPRDVRSGASVNQPQDHVPAFRSPRRSGINTPLKLLDYMKAGRAILATDNVANRLIVSETTAHLVPTTVEGLADGIQRLAADADYRAQLASQGRRLVDERYNFRVFKAALADCYAQVLSSA